MNLFSRIVLLVGVLSIFPQFTFAAGLQDAVSRLEFITLSVNVLFGDSEESATSHIDHLDVIPSRWERENRWNLPVQRCDAVKLVVQLSSLPKGQARRLPYRDVRGDNRVYVESALTKGLITPQNSRIFGCNRVLSHAVFDSMLGALRTELTLPLSVPEHVEQSKALPRRTPRVSNVRGSDRRTNAQTGEVQRSFYNSLSASTSLPGDSLLKEIWGIAQSRFLYQDKIQDPHIKYRLAERLLELFDDPYTSYLSPSSARSYKKEIEGELTGIGAEVERHPDGGVRVVSPIIGSPAFLAGIRPGDTITHVNGKSLLSLSLTDAVERIRGPAGSAVILTVERGGATFSFNIVRAPISTPDIILSYKDNIPVFAITRFGSDTHKDLRELIQKELAQNPPGIILDVRNNPGGYLHTAVGIAAFFLPSSSPVVVVRSASNEKVHATNKFYSKIIPDDVSIVVLVNKGSASASEVLAGALQDHGKATIVGEKTYGKGVIQELVDIQEGGIMKITTGEWLTPNRNSIDKVGITPDVTVDGPISDLHDPQLAEAVRVLKAGRR